MSDATRASHLSLIQASPENDERASLTATQLRAALRHVPGDSHIYILRGQLWALPEHESTCIPLGVPDTPEADA